MLLRDIRQTERSSKSTTYLQGSPRVVVIASTVDKHLPVHEAAAEAKKCSKDSKDSSDKVP